MLGQPGKSVQLCRHVEDECSEFKCPMQFAATVAELNSEEVGVKSPLSYKLFDNR